MSEKPIRYTKHLRERLAEREIGEELPQETIRGAEQYLDDTATGYRIAVARKIYLGRPRLMMVAFEENENEIVAVTIHPMDDGDLEAKLRSGRWK